MKHQIILVGGQILPLYLGIKEFNPDYIHFIASEDSKFALNNILALFSDLKYKISICNPYDFKSISEKLNSIIEDRKEEDEFVINLTGGTKVMVLAAQSMMLANNFKGFYFNHTDSVLVLPEFSQNTINKFVTIDEFFSLSGHKITSFKKIESLDPEDKKAAEKIYRFALNDYRYKKIIYQISKQYKSDNIQIPPIGKILIENKIDFSWGSNKIEISEKGRIIQSFVSKNIISLFFNSSWWEIIVAGEISKSTKIKELLLQAELPFKTDNKVLKNEIDVLINLGRQLIFIECKSGKVKQEDINKMKIIKDTYGGIISKSLLVCFEKPTDVIIEKCEELGIEVYYHNLGNLGTIDLSKIHKSIDKLSKSSLF